VYEVAEWRVAQMMGASRPFASVVPPALIAVLAFPVAAWVAARLDSWRLGR
jgi:rod shape-determining protein MreD